MSKIPTAKIDQIADDLCDYMQSLEGSGKTEKEILEEAVEAIFGGKEQFMEQFLSQLSEEQIQQFYHMLQTKMQKGVQIDPRIMKAIQDTLKKAGASKATEVDMSQSVAAPSTGRGHKGRSWEK